MDLLQADDELLLMELERRDGIYSFIFHELDEENQGKMGNEIDKSVDLKDFISDKQIKISHATSQTAKTSSLRSTALVTSSTNSYSFADCFVNRTSSDISKPWQTNINFQLPVPTANSAFQHFCSLRTFNVRRAKTPFSHLNTPLVRNRRHKLKETKNYNNFRDNITQVADLRELFPLDPDVHAPFHVKRENNIRPTQPREAAIEEPTIFQQ